MNYIERRENVSVTNSCFCSLCIAKEIFENFSFCGCAFIGTMQWRTAESDQLKETSASLPNPFYINGMSHCACACYSS